MVKSRENSWQVFVHRIVMRAYLFLRWYWSCKLMKPFLREELLISLTGKFERGYAGGRKGSEMRNTQDVTLHINFEALNCSCLWMPFCVPWNSSPGTHIVPMTIFTSWKNCPLAKLPISKLLALEQRGTIFYSSSLRILHKIWQHPLMREVSSWYKLEMFPSEA